MSQLIAVVDYGMGNLHSVARAIRHVAEDNDRIEVTDDLSIIESADRVVFPGQGAAGDCMAALQNHNLKEEIGKALHEKPFLGICMGLQVLMGHSEENNGTGLLGLIPGEVRHFRHLHGEQRLKVPHMGWNTIQQKTDHPLWQGIPDESFFYFVHSYYVDSEDASLSTGITDYGGAFTSAIARDNFFAIQAHPEKSAAVGLQLLKNFIGWNGQN